MDYLISLKWHHWQCSLWHVHCLVLCMSFFLYKYYPTLITYDDWSQIWLLIDTMTVNMGWGRGEPFTWLSLLFVCYKECRKLLSSPTSVVELWHWRDSIVHKNSAHQNCNYFSSCSWMLGLTSIIPPSLNSYAVSKHSVFNLEIRL